MSSLLVYSDFDLFLDQYCTAIPVPPLLTVERLPITDDRSDSNNNVAGEIGDRRTLPES